MLFQRSVWLALFACLSAFPSQAADRVALVIGISSYKTLSKLDNPVRDSTAIAGLLRANRFDVHEHRDLDRGAFLDALENFRSAAANAKVAVVYYAGHGFQVGGRNAIAPTDMEISCAQQETKRSIELEKLFEAVQSAPQQIVLLDACRNDPFPQCSNRGGVSGAGFRSIDITPQRQKVLLLANSTLSGRLAGDGAPGSNSPFAASLLKFLESNPRKPLRDILDLVSSDVALKTSGEQTPEVTTRGGPLDFCLSGSACEGSSAIALAPKDEARNNSPPPTPVPSCSATEANFIYLDAIKKNTQEGYREFLSRCPDDKRKETILGFYGRLADEDLWQKVQKEDKLSSYQHYEAAFPKGTYIDMARRRQRELLQAQSGSSSIQKDAVNIPSPRTVSKYIYGVDFSGSDISGYLTGYSLETCGEACRIENQCRAFTYNTQRNICILKSAFSSPVKHRDAVSGTIGEAGVPPRTVELPSSDMILQYSRDLKGGDFDNKRPVSMEACQSYCSADDRCRAFSYVKSKSWCWLKSDVGQSSFNADIVSARKN